MNEREQICTLTVPAVLEKLGVNSAGLSNEEVINRQATYGRNALTPPKPPSAWQIYFSQFKNTLTIILLVAALLTATVWFYNHERSDLIEAGLILAIVVMITFFGFFQEFKAERALAKIKSLLSYQAIVIRDGTKRAVLTAELVPGDIVVLEEGSRVPADLRLLTVVELDVNEAILTGESGVVRKTVEPLPSQSSLAEYRNLAFSGTTVAGGRATAVVIATGNNSEIGKIAGLVTETHDAMTPIQKRLDEIGRIIGLAVAVIAVILFFYAFFFAPEHADSLIERLITAAVAAVALAVAAVPEGLPAVVTIAMAFGTQKMLKKNVLVRKLNSVETLGSVDVICSDKTGTLTTGEMTVTQLWTALGDYVASGAGYLAAGGISIVARTVLSGRIPPTIEGKPAEVKDNDLLALLTIGAICNNAAISPKPTGDPTEIALLVAAQKGGEIPTPTRSHEIPFNSARKMMSVLAGGRVYAKGAPEVILARCGRIQKAGKIVALSAAERRKILTQNNVMARGALRVLACAYKPAKTRSYQENDLIFVGLQGMTDPPRPEIAETIRICRESGIKVVMITGDNPETARAVAKQIGLGERVLAGEQLEKTSDSEFDRLVEVTAIYARVNPDFKLRIIESLKRQGHIVAMTGDGVNDAPALKKADIGVAMGITGTDVAKEASDMVLLDDNFSTIVAAIEEGRGIFHNIRKFVNYLISSNLAEVVIVFVGALIFRDIVLTAVMLLWINVVTDGLPAVAIGLDPAEKGIMKRSPRDFQEEIVTRRDWGQMFTFSLLFSLAVLIVYWINRGEGVGVARTAAFTALVVLELTRIYIIRRRYRLPLLSNPYLVFSVLGSLGLQLAILNIPALRGIFELETLSSRQWWPILVLVAGFLLLPWLFVRTRRSITNGGRVV